MVSSATSLATFKKEPELAWEGADNTDSFKEPSVLKIKRCTDHCTAHHESPLPSPENHNCKTFYENKRERKRGRGERQKNWFWFENKDRKPLYL